MTKIKLSSEAKPIPRIIVHKKLTMAQFRKAVGDATEAEFVSPKLYFISEIMELETFLDNDVFESLFTKPLQKYLNAKGAELNEVIPYQVIDSKLQVHLNIEWDNQIN